MFRVGLYRFSETDARRTLRHAADLLDLMAVGRDPAPLLPLHDAVRHATAHLDVGHDGPAGDVQQTRQHHGSPFQALCLWSEEVIDSFRASGHPLFPGAAGENVTVSGLSWEDVRPGVRLAVGSVQCEVLAFAIPCTKNARWFSDGDFRRIHHDHGSVSRVYAAVVGPGRIEPGDIAVLEP